MAISRTGAFFENDDTYSYGFSDASGRLQITNGSQLTLTSATGIGPFLSAGTAGSGPLDPAALGEIIIRDPGSLLAVTSAGSPTEGGARLTLGRDGGRGVMQVLDGAAFSMTDPFGPDNSDTSGGGEGGGIGRGAGSQGTLEVRASDFLMAGTGSNLSVGREGGTGELIVADGAGFRMETTSAGADDFTHLRIGINDGTGTARIESSFALVQAGLNAGGVVDVGVNGGSGSMTITGSGEAPFRDGLFLVGNAYSPFVEMRLGSEGGTGDVTMDGGTLALANSGVEVLREGGSQRFSGDGPMGGVARLSVGREGGNGTLEANAGSVVFIGAREEASIAIGVAGGAGTLTLDASAMNVQSFEGEAGLMIGEWDGSGAEGALVLQNGSTALFQGADGVFSNIGRRAGNEGSLTIASGSTLELVSDSNNAAGMRVGRNEGTGNLQVTGADSALRLAGELTFGREGGTGTGVIEDGAVVENQREVFTATRVGLHSGSEGLLTMNAGSLITRSLLGEARLDVGVEGANGRLLADAGSNLRVEGDDWASVLVGTQAGAVGALTVEGGSTLEASSGRGGGVEIGIRGGQGTAVLQGSESRITLEARGDANTAYVDIGREDGNATMEVRDGALLQLRGQDYGTNITVGTRGGAGSLLVDDATVRMEETSGYNNIRVGGVRWTHTEDQSGTGNLTLQNGAMLEAVNPSELRAGGGEGSDGTVRVLSGSTLDMGGDGYVGIGIPHEGFSGGKGLLEIDGAGSLLTGIRNLDAGTRGAEGVVNISDGGRALIGSLNADRNVNVNFGFRDGGRGELNITNGLMTVQAGPGNNANQDFLGAVAMFGQQGATALASITGARSTDPDALHGLIVLGHADSDYANIDIGRDADSEGNITVRGAFFGARNDGTSYDADGVPIDLGGDGGYAAVRVGVDGGIGSLDIGQSATLFAASGGEHDGAEILVGRGAGSTGVLRVSDGTQVNIITRQYDGWLLAGTEGGATGTVSISDSSVLIDAARNGGIRLGASWFDNPDQVGTGRLTVENGSDVIIRAQGNVSNFLVGGGAGSDARAIIRDSTVTMEGNAHRLMIVGGTPAFLAGTGGEGQLSLEGATARLNGARDILVGTNGGTGSLDIADGARITLEDAGGGRAGEVLIGVGIGRVRSDEPNTTADGVLDINGAGSGVAMTGANLSRLIVGASGAEGLARLGGGADMSLSAAVSAVEIGIDGGTGWMDVSGAATSLTVGGGDARIHVGRLRYDGAESGDDGTGGLRIGTGASVSVGTKVEIGDASAHGASLVMAGGTLEAPLVELHAGPTLDSSRLFGHGRIDGSAGQPALLMAGSQFFVGDDLGMDGTHYISTGRMDITGHVVKQDGAIHFDIGGDSGGYDQVVVAGSFTMDGGSLHVALGDGAAALLGATGLRLVSASDGIALNNVTLDLAELSAGSAITTQLRANGTELWAVVDDGSTAPAPLPLPPGWGDWLDWIGGGGGSPPPAPSTGVAGFIIADPHLVTLDGLGYSFHAAGEFVLTRPVAGSGFEVQSRMSPVGGNASENVVMAARLDGGTVMVDAATPDSILINGARVSMALGDVVAVGSDLIYRSGNTYHAIHRHGDPDGDAISSASAVVVDGRLDITMFLDASLAGQVEGLLGNYDGDQATDLALPDGRLIARPLVFGDDPETGDLGLYGEFRDAWRVSTLEQSLFTYGPGESPNSFYLPDYPARMVTLDDFDEADRDAAAAQLVDAGLTPGSLPFNNALFDLLSTGNESYVAAATTQQQKIAVLPDTAPPITGTDVKGGELDGLITLTGRVFDLSDSAFSGLRVTFTPDGQSVGHIRNTRAGGDFEFEVLPSASGGRITAMRDYTTQTDGAITASDALDVLRIAVGLQPSFGPASPEALIAADIDRSGQVTASDALNVLRAAVGLSSDHAPRWVFLDATTDLDAISANSVTYETGINLPTLPDAMTGLDMKAILLGQMSEFG